jgi:hypothetical protein
MVLACYSPALLPSWRRSGVGVEHRTIYYIMSLNQVQQAVLGLIVFELQ